jgi:hypothetical protein
LFTKIPIDPEKVNFSEFASGVGGGRAPLTPNPRLCSTRINVMRPSGANPIVLPALPAVASMPAMRITSPNARAGSQA